jgi:PAS domain S-box-containing protein
MNARRAFPTLGRRVLKPVLLFCLIAVVVTAVLYFLIFRTVVRQQVRVEVSALETGIVLSLQNTRLRSHMQRIVTAVGAERHVDVVFVLAGEPLEVILSSEKGLIGRRADTLPPNVLDPVLLQQMADTAGLGIRRTAYRGVFETITAVELTDSSVTGLHPVRAWLVTRLHTRDIERSVLLQLLGSFGVLVFLMVATVVFVSRVIAARITRPLSGLVGQLQDSPSGTLLQAGSAAQTEVGLLVDAFNDALRKLRSQQGFQREVLNHAGAAIIAATTEGVITLFNPEAERLLGYKAGEMVARQTPGVFHDAQEVAERAGELSAELGEVVEPGFEVFVAYPRRGQTETRQWTYVRKDGSRVPVLLSVSALRDDEGRLTGFLGVARDLTEIKAQEQALRQQRELVARRENLLQEVHHRVKNNLQIVSSLLSLQMRGRVSGETAAQLRIAHARINSISTLHELIYDAHDLVSVKLADLTRQLTSCLGAIFEDEAKDVHVEAEIDESIFVPQDKAGPVALILNELVTNSIKHAFPGGQGGRIRVTARRGTSAPGRESATVILEVSDNGAGVNGSKAGAGGLGSLIVERLSKQIRATTENIPQDQGYCTRVTFTV